MKIFLLTCDECRDERPADEWKFRAERCEIELRHKVKGEDGKRHTVCALHFQLAHLEKRAREQLSDSAPPAPSPTLRPVPPKDGA